MQRNHTISIHFAKEVLNYFVNNSQEHNALLFLAGINSKLLKNPFARITPRQLSLLIKAIAKNLKDEFLGLASPIMPLGSFSLLARNALHCKNLFDVYKNTELALRSLSNSLVIELKLDKEQAQVCFKMTSSDSKNDIILTELVLLIWHRFPCWLTNQKIPLLEVGFPFDRTAHEKEYELMFNAKINFNSNVANLVFPLHCLDFSCQRSSTELANYIEQLPELWFKRASFDESISQECLKYISLLDDAKMEDVAKKMNRSVRTLRRNLKDENTQFKEVKAQYMRDKAIYLITETTLSIEAIANTLGYTEASAFSRAFKQWTEASPKEYRADLPLL